MRLRRSAFALILVLLAAASVFAAALHAGAVARSTTLEASVYLQRAQAERAAHAAVAVAITGLLPSSGSESGRATDAGSGESGEPGAPGASGSAGADDEPEEPPSIEFPDILKEILGEIAQDIEDQAVEETGPVAPTGARRRVGGARGASADLVERLAEVGLPTRPLTVELEGRTFTITLTDASGRLNINTAEPATLRRYFQLKGFSAFEVSSLTDQILDWRDEDSAQRPYGAERDRYLRLGIVPADRAFTSTDELLFLPACTPDVFEKIRADLTVTGTGSLHAGTAPPEALRAAPEISEDAALGLIEARSGGRLERREYDRLVRESEEEARAAVRFEPSSLIRVVVRAGPAEGGRTSFTFEGVAALSDRRIAGIALRAR